MRKSESYLDTKLIGIDTEFNQWEELLLLTAYDPDNNIKYVFKPNECIPFLLWLRRKNIKLVAHMAIADIHIIYRNTGILLTNWHCTYTLAKLIGSGFKINGKPMKFGLADLLEKLLKVEMSKEIRKEFITMRSPENLTQELIDYAVSDVLYLPELLNVLLPKMLKNKQDFAYNMEIKLLSVLTKMQNMPVFADRKKVKELQILTKNIYNTEGRKALAELKKINYPILKKEEKVREFKNGKVDKKIKYAYVNIQSSKQLLEVFEYFNIPVPVDTKGKRTTKKEILEQWSKENNNILTPFIKQLIVFANSKNPMQRADYMHNNYKIYDQNLSYTGTRYSSVKAVTHRTTSTSHNSTMPEKDKYLANLQNINARSELGKYFKKCYTVPPGYIIVSCDMSQAEARIAAAISGDKWLVKTFTDGYDIHSIIAGTAYNILNNANENWIYKSDSKGFYHTNGISHRDNAKTFFYAYLNGATGGKLAEVYGVPLSTGKKLFKALEEKLGGLSKFIRKQVAYNKKYGYVWSNRICNRKRYHADPTNATNYYWQSTNADAMKLALIMIDEHIKSNKLDAWIINTVHDSVFVAIRNPSNVCYLANHPDLQWISDIMALSLEFFLGNGVKGEADLEVSNYWK